MFLTVFKHFATVLNTSLTGFQSLTGWLVPSSDWYPVSLGTQSNLYPVSLATQSDLHPVWLVPSLTGTQSWLAPSLTGYPVELVPSLTGYSVRLAPSHNWYQSDWTPVITGTSHQWKTGTGASLSRTQNSAPFNADSVINTAYIRQSNTAGG